MNQRYLFLDVDGVLNHHAFWQARHDLHEKVGFPTKFDVEDQIDLECAERLGELVKKANCRVVLSSVWRILPDQRIGLNFFFKGLKNKFVLFAHTPVSDHRVRGREIQEWMDKRSVKPEQIVIVDDDSDMEHLMHRLVLTSSERGGLTQEKCDEILKMFEASAD